MGCATETYCATCRKRWDCGYGSTLNHYARAERSPFKEHMRVGHDAGYINGDYISRNGDDLYNDSFGEVPETLLVKDYYLFENNPCN